MQQQIEGCYEALVCYLHCYFLGRTEFITDMQKEKASHYPWEEIPPSKYCACLTANRLGLLEGRQLRVQGIPQVLSPGRL